MKNAARRAIKALSEHPSY